MENSMISYQGMAPSLDLFGTEKESILPLIYQILGTMSKNVVGPNETGTFFFGFSVGTASVCSLSNCSMSSLGIESGILCFVE